MGLFTPILHSEVSESIGNRTVTSKYGAARSQTQSASLISFTAVRCLLPASAETFTPLRFIADAL